MEPTPPRETGHKRTMKRFNSCPIICFKDLSGFISNNVLYCLRHKWPWLDKSRFRTGLVPLLFSTLPESVTKVLNIVRPLPSQVEMTELEEDGSMNIRLESWPELSSSYSNRSRLSLAIGQTEPKLDLKQPTSEKGSSNYVQTTLKNRKSVASLLNKGDEVGSHNMKEECIVDESTSAASLILTKERGLQ